MALSIISNFAANVAQRNLTNADMDATRSLAKLSSGKRVVSASDDAASMAIGSRLNAEVKSLSVATTNASQASSMLQIADGALATVDTMLVRMKQLAVQGSSENLSGTERSFIFDEFAALRSEVDRIANDTEFNGNKLIAGSTTFSAVATSIGNLIDTDNGFAAYTFSREAPSVTNGDTLTLSFSTVGNSFTVTSSTGAAQTVAGVTGPAAAGSTSDVSFSQFGLTITLSSAFDTSTFGAVSANNTFTVGETVGATTLSFRIGTGASSSEDELSFSLQSATVSDLSSDLAGVTGFSTVVEAENSITYVANAIDQLNSARAAIGASQNRLEFASQNLRSSMENNEAARSTLLDLDVAAEMTNFTSKQILVQSGVSMLAQANQMPQNLLRLLQ